MTEEEQKQKLETEKLPIDFMMTESMNQQLITLNKLNKGGKKMQMPMQMGQPQESSWEELRDQVKISIANSEKNLLLARAQLKEIESHIKEE